MKKYIGILLLMTGLSSVSCKDYLDIKPNKKLVILSTTQEAQSLLNYIVFTTGYPATGEIASDNYYIDDVDWGAIRSLSERNAYIWAGDVFNESSRNDWSLTYVKVYNANLVIDAVTEGKLAGSQEEQNKLLGQALFCRSFAFYQLLQLFAKPWDATSSLTDLGIPLRLSSDFNIPSHRETVSNCYKRIIEDLLIAAEFLENQTITNTRPNKQAAHALLARVYLLTEDYEKAVDHSNRVLRSGMNTLMDFKELDPNKEFSFRNDNEEVIWLGVMMLPQILNVPVLRVDTTLIKSYKVNDLRAPLFFTSNTSGSYSFKGSYHGQNSLFCGLALNEIYFIKAEALARLGKSEESVATLNEILMKRYDNYKTLNFEEEGLLNHILEERKKELVFRGLRWTDLRRLNKEDNFKTVIRRRVNGLEYTLNPGDKAYVFQIPEDVIRLSGIEQN